MAHPGMKAGDDYVLQPYLPDWQPLPDRAWAMKYVNDDGTENMVGFIDEFRVRHPHLWVNQVPAYIPACVDDYLRRDPNGERLDIDWELALTPLTDEEKAEMEAAKRERIREKRMTILRKRGKPVPEVLLQAKSKPGPKPKTAPESLVDA